jgi:apolipoprotein N-acyltransferase
MMAKILNNYSLAFILGALCDLSFAPFHWFLAAIISISGFFILINLPEIDPQKSLKESFKLGWFYGFGYFLAGIYWIAISLLVDAEKFAWLIPFALILIPGILAGYFALLAFFYQKIITKFRLNESQKIIIFSLLWLIFELLRSYLFSGFAWNLIGYIWLASDNLSQLSSIFGIYGLSLFAILVCLVPCSLLCHLPAIFHHLLMRHPHLFLCHPREGGDPLINRFGVAMWIPAFAGMTKEKMGMTKKVARSISISTSSILYLIFIVIFLITSFSYGHFRIKQLSTYLSAAKDSNAPKIRIVQANIKQDSKWDQPLMLQNLKKHISLSNSGRPKNIAAIIWSETSIPYILNHNDNLISYLKSSILDDNQILITGALRANFDKNDPSKITKIWNSVYAIDNKGITGYYDKNHLVPFGEYIPFSEFIPFITKITNGSIDFSSGDKNKIIKTPYFSFTPLICYEVSFSDSLLSIDKDPNLNLIINLTNDAWFGNSSGPYQHFDMAKMRAIEYGTPLIRVANTGISAAFDALGRVIAKIDLNQEGVVDIDIPKKLNEHNIYVSYGFKPLILAIILLISYLFVVSFSNKNLSKK